MSSTVQVVVGIASALVGVAIVAVIVSRNSVASEVITTAGGVYAAALREAVTPITAE